MDRLSAALNYQNTERGRAVMDASLSREKASTRARNAKRLLSPRFMEKSLLHAKLQQMLVVIRDKPTVFGCSAHELQEHFRRQFKEGWTFGNRGQLWEIDHVVPVAKFKQYEFMSAFHYTNLRPRSCALNRIDGWRIRSASKYM